jgi:hypothetical protein
MMPLRKYANSEKLAAIRRDYEVSLWDVTRRGLLEFHAEFAPSAIGIGGSLLSAWRTQDEAWNAAKALAKSYRGKAILHARKDYDTIVEVCDYSPLARGVNAPKGGQTRPQASPTKE